MIGRFGAQLRQRREEQGIDLIAIAAQTKIKMSLLEALERDDVSHWPSGIFRRAYIRTYAQAIGLDPDAVLREFLEAFPEPAEVVTTEAIASAVDSRVYTGPPTRLRYIVGSAFSSLTRFRRPQQEELPAAPVLRAGPVVVTSPRLEEELAVVEQPTVEHMDLAEVLMTEPLSDTVEEPSSQEPLIEAEVAVVSPMAEEPVELPTFEEPSKAIEPEPAYRGVDFSALAEVCTAFGQVQHAEDLGPLLGEAARVLEAPGVILWIWDPELDGLRAALAHGYSDRVLAQLPVVGREADNATAAAFRRGQACSTRGDSHTNGALVIPLLTGGGCAGALAVELPHGREQDPSVHAAAAIVAAMLAQLAGVPASSQPGEDETEGLGELEPPVRQTAGRR